MQRLTRRQFAELGKLQKELRQLTQERDLALRVFTASCTAATREMQIEYWLEFSWIDYEYRATVNKIARICSEYRHAIV